MLACAADHHPRREIVERGIGLAGQSVGEPREILHIAIEEPLRGFGDDVAAAPVIVGRRCQRDRRLVRHRAVGEPRYPVTADDRDSGIGDAVAAKRGTLLAWLQAAILFTGELRGRCGTGEDQANWVSDIARQVSSSARTSASFGWTPGSSYRKK